MIRLSSAFWLILGSATALATYAVKYEVQALDDLLTDAKKATAAEHRELRVLDAEWAYLNRPDMLAVMNQRFLSLAPITTKQLQTSITDIPMRPPPPPPPPPQPSTTSAAPNPAPGPQTGPVAAVAAPPPENAPPVTRAALDRQTAPEQLAMASAAVKPVLVKATAPPNPASPRTRELDSRSLDQLIARIAASR